MAEGKVEQMVCAYRGMMTIINQNSSCRTKYLPEVLHVCVLMSHQLDVMTKIKLVIIPDLERHIVSPSRIIDVD